jgi:nucleotide-binding universal stress UspA family protein
MAHGSAAKDAWMIKTILVPATGSETDQVAYATAFTVARLFGARVDALHVRLDPVAVGVAMSTEGAGGTLLPGIINSLTRDADEAERKAKVGFANACSRAGVPLGGSPSDDQSSPSAQFNVETGQETLWMANYGLTADLAVASRGAQVDAAAARSRLEALLLDTGRPLLISGAEAPSPDFIDRVAIAWKPTEQAARAVAFAMPFLGRAKEITVLTIEEEEGQRDPAERLVAYLRRHEIKAVSEQLAPGPDGGATTLLAAARQKSSLLVMGGYGRSRLREWVFGGFTQSVLDHAELPVLMAH